MITVHHLENSRSHRIIWLLEELKLDYKIVHYQRDKKTMLAPPELKAIHPLGKSPIIIDDTNGNTVAETGAIIDYLMDHYDEMKLRPASGTPERLRYNYWLHYAEGSVMPMLLMKLVFARLGKPPMPLPLRPVAGLIAAGVQRSFINPRIQEHLSFMENELNNRQWFCGRQFTAADVMLSFVLQGAAARGSLSDYPDLTRVLDKMLARQAYKRAIKTGGELTLLSS